MKNGVSVVIPIFSDVHQERLLPTIDSVLMQDGIREIIISEQAAVSRLMHLSNSSDIRHVLSAPPVMDGVPRYNAGAARNAGLKHARQEYIYFNDADVVFLQKDYLQRLIAEIREREILIRTAMWRLLQDEVPAFLELHERDGIESALTKLSFLDHYQATLSDNPTMVEPVEHDNRLFTATPEILEQYRNDPALHGQENLLWQRTMHCGAIFGKKEHVEAVGGYSENYPLCVYEDSDVQWKLRDTFTVRELHTDPAYAVLHLDHDLPYRSMELESGNRTIFERRKMKGAAACTEEDARRFQQPIQ